MLSQLSGVSAFGHIPALHRHGEGAYDEGIQPHVGSPGHRAGLSFLRLPILSFAGDVLLGFFPGPAATVSLALRGHLAVMLRTMPTGGCAAALTS